MSSTHRPDNSRRFHAANFANATKPARQQVGFMKRTRVPLAALVVVGVLATGFVVVSGRAAGLGFHLPAIVSRVFKSRNPRTLAPPRMIAAPVPLVPRPEALVSTTLVINEIDYDQVGTDTAEFVELKNVSAGTINLLNYSVELVNGNAGGAAIYDTIALPNINLAAGDYYVICANTATVVNCDLDDGPDTDFIQNGSPDAVGLRLSGALIDAVSYEGNSGAPYTETTGTPVATASDSNTVAFIGLSRFADGTDTDSNSVDVTLRCITPGVTNTSASTGCTAPVAPPKYRSRQIGNWNDFNTWQIDTGGGFVDAVTGQTPTSAADTVQIRNAHSVTVTASVSADQLTVDSGGAIQVNPSQTLTIADGGGTDLTNNGTVAVVGTIANSGQVLINNLLRVNGNPGGSVTGNALAYGASSTLEYSASGAAQTTTSVEFPAVSGPPNVTINNGSGVTLHAARTITGTLDLVSGNFTTGGNLSMANGSQITKSDGNMTGTPAGVGTYNVVYSGMLKGTTSELAGAGLTNVTVDMNPSQLLILDTTRTVPGTLALTNGMVSTGSFTLIANGAVTRNTGMVVGNLQRRFTGSGTLIFDVGTISNSYSPVVVNATTGTFPAQFAVSATIGPMPGISGANKLARYWSLTNIGSAITSANLTFNYPSGDVVGTAANYKFIRKTGTALSILNPTGTPTSTSATINGVTSFSDWTLAEANAVQSGSLQFSSPAYSVVENEVTASITATRTGGSDGDVSLDFATVAGGDAVGGATCTAGTDYVNTSGTLSWPAGDSANKSFAITICDDAVGESNETVNLQVSNNQGGAALGSPNTAVLTITNDDATDVTFNANGNLNAGTYNNITINSPAVVTTTGNVVVNGCVSINSGGRLDMGTFTFTGAGCFTLGSGATLGIGSTAGITSGATGNVQVGGARTFSSGANYVYNGSADQAVGNALPGTVANLTIANTGTPGTVTGNSNQIVTVTLLVQDGVYASASDYNDVVIASMGTLSLAADITVGGNWTNNGTFIANGFAVTFDGTANQGIGGTSVTPFATLNISNNGGPNNTVSLTNNVTVSGDLTVSSNGVNNNVFDLGANTADRTSAGGTFSMTGNTILKIGGTNSFPANYATVTLANNSEVDYNGASQTVANHTYGYLTLLGSGTKTLPNTPMTVAGVTQITGATVSAVANAAIDFQSGLGILNSASFTGGSFTHTVNQQWLNGGTFVDTGSTINFNGGLGASVGTSNFNNVIFSGSGTIFATGALSIAGNVSITSNFDSGGFSHTVGGNWSNSGTFTAGSGTVTFNGATGQTISGTTSFYNLVKSVGAAQTFNFAAGSNTTVANSLTLTGAAGQPLTLRSTTPGTQWNLNAPATQSVSFVDVQDSNANSDQTVTATSSINSGNNLNWIFTQAAVVYVDDDFTGPNGTDPDMGGPATSFGYDAFATIQNGVNGVATGGTVNVAAGSYVENVTIPKALTLTGAGAGSVFVYPAVSNPNCGGAGGGSICAGGSNILLVQASNVTISGMTLDGDNTTLPGGFNVGGANVDARNGIITNHLAGVFNNLEVHHTTVKNIFLRGMYASSSGTFNFHDNTVQNVQANAASIGMFNFAGAGAYTNNTVSACNDAISSNHSRGTTYTGNTVTTSASGIHSDNAGDSGGTPDTISGNTVTNSQTFGYGIWVFVPYKTVTVQNNTVTNTDVGYAVFGDSGVTTTTKPENGNRDKSVASGREVPGSANVDEPANGFWRAPKVSNDGVPGPDAPPVAPFSASFKGNTADGQNKANSTGVYFTTSQIGFGSGNPKVEFTSNTVVNNVDGFYLETESGFTLETAASFNRIVNNTGTQVTTANAGTLNGSMENNWWGCNAGPNNLGCGNIVGSGVDFDPWIVLGISASPGTIPPGGSTTVTADMTHNSNNAVPSVTDFVPPVAVTFGATNGTVFPTSGTITNGQATTTFTSNSTSSGSASATVDNQTVNTAINVTAANTYTWSPTLGTSWILPTNWTPTRLLPQANDTLVINGTTTPGPTITDVPTQTIAGLHLINGPLVTLQADGTNTLTISGGAGSDLSVPALASLTISGSNDLTIKVSGAGSTGTIGGVFIELAGAHRLFGDAGGVITFQNNSLATTGTGLTSNPFGTGAAGDGDTGSVIFASGSTYSHNGGQSPFGTAGNGPVAQFQIGSLARWFTNTGFQASGRTYADLEIGDGTNAVNVSDSGTGNFQFDNLTIKSTSSANSSLTYTGSGTATITIRGNVTSTGAGNGGTLPDLILTPGSGGTHINKNGGGTLILNATGNARAVDLEGGATVENGTTLSLGRVVLLGLSNPHLNTLTVATGADITGGPTGYVVGSLSRSQVPNGSSAFPVGTAGAYSPVDLANSSGGGSLTVVARTPQQPLLAPATSLNRYWSLTQATGVLTTDLTFHYLDGDVFGSEANYRLVIAEAGNATSFPDDCPNTCVDESANTIHRVGVSTFSDWTAAEPAAPTAVKLTGFSAMRSGDEVKLQWQSGYEARNLGYNIYREQDGKRVAITPSLVAGSALVAGNGTRLTAGLSYAWYDIVPGGRGQGSGGRGQQTANSKQQTENGGQRSAVDGQPSVTYWLEDVDINGTRTLHGPIAVTECGEGDARCQQTVARSQLLNEVANPQSAIRNSKFATGIQLSSWPAAITTPDPRTNEPDPTEMQRTIAGLPAVKVSVSRAGWYRITQPQVLAAGLNISDANGLQLYRDGRQVAFRLSNSTEQFGPTDYLEFYGEGLNSGTAAAQTYYLVKLAEPGKRIEVKEKNVGPGDRVSPQGFAYTVERKERMIYFSGLRNGDAENFFGQVVSNTAATAAIPVSHLDPTAGTPAQLEVVLQGVTNQSHLVQVKFNGTDLGAINFANTDHPSRTFSVPPGVMLDGNNTVELTSLGGAADVSLVDVLRLTYVRSYIADNDALAFNLDSRQTKRLTGFTNEHIRVVDVTDPNEPVELTPDVLPDGGGFAALSGVDKEVRAPFSRPHKLIAFADGQADTVDALGLNEPSSLWSETAGADYVMITTAALKASIEPLAQLRRNQGMVVHVVDVEDLYDEFSFGEHSPQAIHDYLATALADWTRKPHYLLLAGDASYDPKNYTGQGTNDLVPSKLIDTALQETASDDWLADFNSDGMADISVGRLPTRTLAETNALVSKIIGYENAAPDPSRTALLVADNNFEGPSSALQSLLPPGMTVATINRSSADDATIHDQIIAGLNQGPLVANYIGHGSNGVWTGASLLSSDDAPTLTNTNRLSVFTMMTCFNGFFQDAYNDSLSEALLKAPGGAVAVWASTTLTEPGGQNAIDQEFYRLLFGAQPATLGDAARAAKVVTTDADVRRTWTLFGDPAMRLQ